MQRLMAFLAVAMLLASEVAAQTTGLHVRAEAGSGTLLDIYPNYPASDGVQLFGLAFYNSAGKACLHQEHGYPRTGLQLTLLNLGNADVLGQGLGIQYMNQRHKKISKRLTAFAELDLGAMLFNKPYNVQSNAGNIAVGDYWSFLVSLRGGLQVSLTNRISMAAYGAFVHGSNAHTALPNVGINVPAVMLSAIYQTRETSLRPDHHRSHSITMQDSTSWHWRTQLGIGYNENGTSTSPTNGAKYPIYLAGVWRSKQVGRVGWLSLGAQAYYNTGYRTYLASQEVPDIANHWVNASVLLLDVGYEIRYGRFGAETHLGINVFAPFVHYWVENTSGSGLKDVTKKYLPGKFGVNYYLPPLSARANAYVGVFVKSNVGQADFLETALGIRF